MALATPLLPFLPLAAKQILLNNFLSDVPSIAISSDNVDPDRVARPQRQHFMIVFGLISSVFDLLTFAVLLLVFQAGEATFQTSWFIISLLTELAVVLVLRTHKPRLSQQPQPVAVVVDAGSGGSYPHNPFPRRAEFGVRLRAAVGA
jgi:Mg2+-importing ATPase